MAASHPLPKSQSSVDFAELSLELAQLEASNLDALGGQVVSACARCLGTDRVSLILLDKAGRQAAQAYFTGFSVAMEEWPQESMVIAKLRKQKQKGSAASTALLPLFLYDIREHAELVSPWADSYRTDAVAIYPIEHGRRLQGALCISNLSAQQILQLENSAPEMELVTSQLRQLCIPLQDRGETPGQDADLSVNELSMLKKLIESLDRSMDTRDVIVVFSEIVSSLIPIHLMAVIHDQLQEPSRGVVCLRQPAHESEVQSLFGTLAKQWQKRHRQDSAMELKDCRIIDQNLMKSEGECPPELMIGGYETFPIFLDNDLFALVCLGTDEDTLANRKLLNIFDILVQYLLLHIKKSLLMAQNQEMQTVDALTGLHNERYFYQTIEREFARASRYNVPLTLLFIDIDHFKDVNETYGFETGDLVLQDVSQILMDNMRNTDYISRYSGERFVLMLPETHYKNGDLMANRLRRFIENNSFFIPNTNVYIKVTVSIGVTSYLEHKPTSLAQFIEFADTALYFAKRNGRNLVVGYSYVINMMSGDIPNES
ncbi:GGDEF domain-containing protein [bacterium]|nr:GGDEF domain-containing protein [bacterium]